MGGNGTFAAGKIVAYRWKTVGKIDGVKVLAPVNSHASPKLLEEAHSSRMYIKQFGDGNFSQLRVYDSQHRFGSRSHIIQSPRLTRVENPCYTTTYTRNRDSSMARPSLQRKR